MIRINLLPEEEKRFQLPLKRIFSSIGLVVAVLVITAYSYTLFSIWDLEQKIQEKHNQYESLRPTQEVMALANSREQNINSKNNILIGLTKERQSWYSLITHLSEVTIPQVWFTEVGVVDKNMLKIKGMAYTYPDLANFLQKMEPDDMFSEPTLVNTERDASTAAAKFEMMLKIKGR